MSVRPQPPRRPDELEQRAELPGGLELLERLRELPGGRELLELVAAREDVELVGGAVRDLLLQLTPRELDVVVVGTVSETADAAASLARELEAALGGSAGVQEHERFGTASVRFQTGCIDIATRRAESYAAPGALPTVGPGTPEQDLARRDFTVNAIALILGGAHRGELRHVPEALEDLCAARLRVLHEQSFIDDPTRLLRLARYAARLDFTIEQRTAALAGEALAAGALATVSGSRLGAELRLALGEADPLAALAELDRLGVLTALHPRLRFEQPLAREALALLPADGRADLLLLAAVALPLTLRADGERDAELRALLDRLQFVATDRDLVVASALAVPRLVEQLPECASASQLHAVAAGAPAEGVALAGALGASDSMLRAAARRWLGQLRGVRLQISGDDLLAAGIPGGPELGRRLHATLMLRLDGELAAGRDVELAAALAWTAQ
jgi:tRNA nucleotidyltransferase (CCA-adding enzyme)